MVVGCKHPTMASLDFWTRFSTRGWIHMIAKALGGVSKPSSQMRNFTRVLNIFKS